MNVKTIYLKNLSPADKQSLFLDLHSMAKQNVKEITKEYLQFRLNRYPFITLAWAGGEPNTLLAFCFSKIYFMPFLFFNIPVFHLGLTVVAKNQRGKKISSSAFYSLYDFAKKNHFVKKTGIFFTGALLSAKCSSPVSFLKIKSSAFHLNWPRVKNENSLSWFSRSFLSRRLSLKLSWLLADQASQDFILKQVNKKSGFQLEEENYSFSSKKSNVIVRFFKKNIMPHNELITVVWFHPLMAVFKRKSLSKI